MEDKIEISFKTSKEDNNHMRKQFEVNLINVSAREISEMFESLKYDVLQMFYFQKGLNSKILGSNF